jgi:hypothetical protein
MARRTGQDSGRIQIPLSKLNEFSFCPLRCRMQGIRPSQLCLATVLVLASAVPAAAQEVTLEQAVERVQKDTDGRVLAAEEIDVGKRRVYRIKVLTREGSVRRVLVSADAKDSETGKNDKGAPAARTERNGKGR